MTLRALPILWARLAGAAFLVACAVEGGMVQSPESLVPASETGDPGQPHELLPLAEDAMPTMTDVEWHPTIDSSETYLRWNAEDVDGTWAFVHVTPDHMPLRVSIGLPADGALDGSRTEARAAAIDGMRLWESALVPHLPWFRLEFVESDSEAPVQVEWKRRMLGSAAGRGGIRYVVDGGRLHVGGQMTISTIPYYYSGERLKLNEVRLLVAHEFGHVLGLAHCLDCDSIMNYSWETLNRDFVTELDVLTFRALVERPNGLRWDGKLMRGLAPANGEPR